MENKNNNSPIIPPCAPCCKPLNGVLVFGLGVLIGAVVATAAFMIGAHYSGHGRGMIGSQQMRQIQAPQDMPNRQGNQGQNSQNNQHPDRQDFQSNQGGSQ